MVRDIGEGREWLVLGPARVLTNLMKRDYPNDRIVSLSTVDEIKRFVEEEEKGR